MRLAVWEPDEVRWPRVQSVALACGAQCERLAGLSLRADRLGRFDAAIVRLHDATDDPDPALALISALHAAGTAVITHACHVEDWPVRAKCRALLAGAATVLDNAARFEESLRAALEATLSGIQRARDDERRTREIARENGVIGRSASLLEAFRQAMRLSALSDLPVLIYGESGTGKELFAKAIHALDPKRRDREMVAINCAAINPNVAESELFGYTRGAFTGAVGEHPGLFSAAEGGVLFLDEIGELTLELQAKLLRVLQEKRMRRLGASRDVPVDVRVIAATNQDLPHMIREGRFRNDLFHRLNSLSIHIAPLRERTADVPPLVAHFVRLHDSCEPPRCIEADLVDAVSRLALRGNVRELQNLVTTSLARKTDGSALGLRDLPPHVWLELLQTSSAPAAPPSRAPEPTEAPSSTTLAIRIGDRHQWNLGKCLAECEREIVMAAMLRTRNNQSQAARLLGLTPRSVYNKLRKHNLVHRPPA